MILQHRKNELNEQTLHDRILAGEAAHLTTAELFEVAFNLEGKVEAIAAIERSILWAGGLNGLVSTPVERWQTQPELSGRLISQIGALFELTRRINERATSEQPTIHSARDAAALLNDMRDLVQEHVRVLLLDSHDRLMGIVTVYVGTLNTSLIRAAEVFREAILRNSASVILAHNHPTGDPQPSPDDVQMSRGLAAAGRLLDIPLRDHVIIGRRGWVSLKELGLM